MKFKLLLIFFMSTIQMSTGCRSANAHQEHGDPKKALMQNESDISVEDLDNSDVSWDGNFLGLQPRLSDRAKSFGRTLSPDEKVALIAALDDENRYVIAHVLLSRGTDFQSDASQWNGLHVELKAGNSVSYPEGQMERLQRFWRE
jgi:hypothetical protein